MKKIFLGSSMERKDDMEMVAQWIRDARHEPKTWDDPSVFRPGEYIFSELLRIRQKVDAAILIFGEDDDIWYRGDFQAQARDNVLIEYGLFAGALGKQNTLVCIRGNPKKPTNLHGIVDVVLDRPDAREKISCWIKNLKSKSALVAIREGIEIIEKQKSRPFQRWLYMEHLKSSQKAIKSISKQMGRKQYGSGAYDLAVTRKTMKPETDTILALCGKKFKALQDNIDYFKKFYEFAIERNERGPRHGDGISMCRIFMREKGGEHADAMAEIINSHREHRDVGVLALTIKADKRKRIERYFGERFCKHLDRGFGFLLFYRPEGKSVAITHEGVDKELGFVVLKDELNLYKILQIFRGLCEQTEEYDGTGEHKERRTLDDLLKRLHLPVRPWKGHK